MSRMPLSEHPAALLHEAASAGGDATPSVTVTGGPTQLRIRCTDTCALATLWASLAPALQPAESAAAGDIQDIRVVFDPGLARRLESTITATGQAGEPHLVRDGIHLVRKQAGDAPPEHRSGYLLWAEDAPQTSCIVLGGSGTPSDIVLLRLVRGVAARVLLAAGWIPLHSACVMTTVGAVCLLGGHGSGKTTALLHLLAGAAGPVALVANSIVLLSPHGAAEVRTLPTAIGLRAPTIRLFPALDRLVGKAGVAADAAHRVYLPAALVAEALGVSRSAGGSLAAFVNVVYRGTQRSTWHRLATQERETALLTAYLPNGLVDDPHEHSRLATNHARRHDQRLRQCAGATPAAVLEPGTDTARVLGGLAGLLSHQAG